MSDGRGFAATAPDGRALGGTVWGDDGAPLIVYHHGTPAGALPDPGAIADVLDRGARLAAYARPGYPGSTRAPGRTVGDCVGDVLAVADHLGAERFAVYGHSGGGPHTLACAASGSGRIVATAAIAGVAPYAADGLDWLAGQGEDNVAEWTAALEGEATLRPLLEQERAGILAAAPEDIFASLASLLSPPDQAMLTGEVAEYFRSALAMALADGVDGWVDDDFAFLSDWGFALDDVRAPLMLVHGDQDFMAPTAHTEWLAERLPQAETRLLTGEGHLTVVLGQAPATHAWLLDRLG